MAKHAQAFLQMSLTGLRWPWEYRGELTVAGVAQPVRNIRPSRDLLRLGPPGLPPCGRLGFEEARRDCALGVAGSSAARLMGRDESLTGGGSDRGLAEVSSSSAAISVDRAGGGLRGGPKARGLQQQAQRPGTLRGTAGVSLLPGSAVVEDPVTGAMLPCTTTTTTTTRSGVVCPFAEPHPNPALAAQGVLVNRAPHPGRGPYFLAVSTAAPPDEQLAAWRRLAAAASPAASWARVADPRVFASPVREEQLQPEVALDRLAGVAWGPGGKGGVRHECLPYGRQSYWGWLACVTPRLCNVRPVAGASKGQYSCMVLWSLIQHPTSCRHHAGTWPPGGTPTTRRRGWVHCPARCRTPTRCPPRASWAARWWSGSWGPRPRRRRSRTGRHRRRWRRCVCVGGGALHCCA